MEHFIIDPAEMELRNDRDFNASLAMIGEGSPVYEPVEGEEGGQLKSLNQRLQR